MTLWVTNAILAVLTRVCLPPGFDRTSDLSDRREEPEATKVRRSKITANRLPRQWSSRHLDGQIWAATLALLVYRSRTPSVSVMKSRRLTGFRD